MTRGQYGLLDLYCRGLPPLLLAGLPAHLKKSLESGSLLAILKTRMSEGEKRE